MGCSGQMSGVFGLHIVKMAAALTGRCAGLPALALISTALVLGGCGSKPPVETVATPPAAMPTTTDAPPGPVEVLGPRARLARALERLGQGQSDAARLDVVAILAMRPRDRVALDLLQQIDSDPRDLLGRDSYAYQIRAGETLSSISGRLLRNRYRFWALARYNNIAVPVSAEVGQTILIPGRAPGAPVARPIRPTVAERPAAKPVDRQVERPVERPVVQPARTNPAAAARLRNQGLGEMARGSIDKAVRLLERALTFDPANATIIGDLGRARKIQQAVRTQ